MLTYLGYLDSKKRRQYKKLENQDDPFTAVKDLELQNGFLVVAGVPLTHGIYLHGCKNEADMKYCEKQYGKDTIWYRQI